MLLECGLLAEHSPSQKILDKDSGVYKRNWTAKTGAGHTFE
jgi:hypothetical protein